jgi:RNA-binding protein YlmH
MKIFELLTEQESSKVSRKRQQEMGFEFIGRHLNRIKAGEYEMSIQASYAHYCEPRETLEDLTQYTEMELALFKNGGWVQPREDEKIKQFPRYLELEERYEEGDVAVAGYVPVDLLQDLYDYLSA